MGLTVGLEKDNAAIYKSIEACAGRVAMQVRLGPDDWHRPRAVLRPMQPERLQPFGDDAR